jgi:hypothetical protein
LDDLHEALDVALDVALAAACAGRGSSAVRRARMAFLLSPRKDKAEFADSLAIPLWQYLGGTRRIYPKLEFSHMFG